MTSKVLILTRDAGEFAALFARHMPEVACFASTEVAQALTQASGCDVLMTRNDDRFADVIGAMPQLRWIQALTTGTDRIEAFPGTPAGVAITAARGFHGPQMSELAFLFMLALARDFPAMLANQKAQRWQRTPQKLLAGKTVTVLGVGRIAEELAARCKVFGMTVIGVSAGRMSAPGFDAIHPRERLAEATAIADVLVVLAPSTKETHHLVDAAILNAMKPSAVLINLSRGDVVDEAALVAALTAQRIAGAGLDVFQTEPLPAGHPLWSLPNVIVTSHIGGMSDNYAEQVMPLVVENLRAYLAGTPSHMRYIVRI